MAELFNADKFWDPDDFGKLLVRLVLDLLVTTFIVKLIYYRKYRRKEYVFVFYLLNIVTLFICVLLRKVPIELGFALGLFAVFGILRYRTEAMRSRELTYLFVVIGVAIWNGLSNKKISVSELFLVNIVTAATIFLLERSRMGGEDEQIVLYDRIDLLAPERREELVADLTKRTGLNVRRVEVGQIDLLRDTANITVFFRS
ncbi:MAG: DUF4956 domain-containing protein [Myxococcales bacterium]|nr:DUF4956 domain-containing protein [Myxococcales bacterium]